MSGIASRKRRRQSDVPSQSQPDSASALVKQALFTLNCEEGVNEDLFETAQESLSAAFKATRAAEKSLPPEAKPLAFDWHLPPETIIKLDHNDIAIYTEFFQSRHLLASLGATFWPVGFEEGKDVLNLREWVLNLPGEEGTDWEGAVFTARVIFKAPIREPDVPLTHYHPKVLFTPPVFHPQSYPSGTWSSIVRHNWEPSKDKYADRLGRLIDGIRHDFAHPDFGNPCSTEPYSLEKKDPEAYKAKIREQTIAHTPDPVLGLAGRPAHRIKTEE